MKRPKCETCKHWEPPAFEWRKGFGECIAFPSEASGDNDALAIHYDYEGYISGFRTKADFGCVGWESK